MALAELFAEVKTAVSKFAADDQEQLLASFAHHLTSATYKALRVDGASVARARLFRVLDANEKPEHGLSAVAPLATDGSQCQRLSSSDLWLLYQITNKRPLPAPLPRVALIDSAQLLGSLVPPVAPSADYQLEGYVPPAAVLRVFALSDGPVLARLTQLPEQSDFAAWLLAVSAQCSTKELADLFADSQLADSALRIAEL